MADSTQPGDKGNAENLRKLNAREAGRRFLEKLKADPVRFFEYKRKKAAISKQWRIKNKDKTEQYRKENAALIKARKAKWHQRTKDARAEKIATNARRRCVIRKEELRQYQKAYRQLNAQALSEKRKAYYQKHKETFKKRSRSSGKEYYAKNRTKVLERCKRYTQQNKDAVSERGRNWYQRNKKEILQKRKDCKRSRRATDATYAIECRLRARMASALRAASALKRSRSSELLGCSSAELHAHLESLFSPGMSWENRHLWHIDHIIPCSAFDLRDEEQQAACFHFTNLRPMWAKENLRKRDSLPPGQGCFGFGYSARIAVKKAQSKQEVPTCETTARQSKKKPSTATG
jgi:hypothetical protein